MTDRDRLAADLRNMHVGIYSGADEIADRLIALGWTRLDEERLARALLEPYDEGEEDPEWGIPGRCRACGEDGVWSKDKMRDIAAIAKAYREDTDHE